MNHNIKGTGLQITDELRGYVEKRLLVADKFVGKDSTAHADVELEFAQVRDGGKYRAEFNLALGGGLYRAEQWGHSMHEAIDLAIAVLENELRKTKKKHQHLVRRGAGAIKDMVRGLRDRF
ncbi:MAG: ribosome-associated translation inhibitor RaiA [Candidatus Pacebacteria bacterium]|nr:ribosome-associated translation inhibitor RaiA [Candidatus Paceibacterota bacterium]